MPKSSLEGLGLVVVAGGFGFGLVFFCFVLFCFFFIGKFSTLSSGMFNHPLVGVLKVKKLISSLKLCEKEKKMFFLLLILDFLQEPRLHRKN